MVVFYAIYFSTFYQTHFEKPLVHGQAVMLVTALFIEIKYIIERQVGGRSNFNYWSLVDFMTNCTK